MIAVFDKLKSLQEILFEKFSLERDLLELPKSLSKKQEVLQRNKKTYAEATVKAEEMRKQYRSLEIDLQEAGFRRETYEKQMDAIKTQKEYEALDKEIHDASDREQSIRKELLRIEKEIEIVKAENERLQGYIELNEEELNEEEKFIHKTEEEKKSRIVTLNHEEKSITPGMDSDVLFKFERIIRSKSGLGIVAIRRGVCTGCHIILPYQYVNEVRKTEKVMFCPYCSRVLFFESERGDLASEPAYEAGSLADLDSIDEES